MIGIRTARAYVWPTPLPRAMQQRLEAVATAASWPTARTIVA